MQIDTISAKKGAGDEIRTPERHMSRARFPFFPLHASNSEACARVEYHFNQLLVRISSCEIVK
jgi:hypothetical protein